ncbi:MAG: thioredoxin family protein [Deltaproteobacteria bacterium]|nr:thioredoxin family protein [Deltaproteobacteria bacterium]
MKKLLTRLPLAAAAFALVAWLPALSLTGSTGAATDLGLGRYLAEGSALAFGAAFAGGVLTSLTPCVYPLIPITVSIFGARSARTRRQAVALSLLYVLGIAATYTALGVAAALGGKAFGTVMTNPWAVGFVALVLAAMAASMFGAFELALPASWQARLSSVGGTGYAGALGMGLVAGIIAAPCTGPVLAAALAFVAAKGSVTFGAGIMFVYALGIGLLFFLIGAFSVALPKSGPWMETVKSFFGVALLAAAGLFAKDAFPALRAVFSPAPQAVLWAAAAAALGLLLGALDLSFGGPARHRLAKGLGVALAVLAVVYAVGSGAARREALAREDGLPWIVNDEARALALARAEGKPVLVDFWADWCAACIELDHTAWADPAVREEAKKFVLLKIDNSTQVMDDARVAAAVDAIHEKYGIVGQPTVLFIDRQGRELPAQARVTAVVDGVEMLRRMRSVDQTCTAAVACLARW